MPIKCNGYYVRCNQVYDPRGRDMAESLGGGRMIGPCKPVDGGWVLSGPAAQRLFDKSAIGKPMPENQLLLQASEMLFCARHRHLQLEDNWLENELSSNVEILHETAAMEALRVPGEKIVLSSNVVEISPESIVSNGTWALRWERTLKVKNDLPTAEVIWVREFEPIDWPSLYEWAAEVNAIGRIAEVLIVDEEMGVTTYRVTPENPRGALKPIDESNLTKLDGSLLGNKLDGAFVPSKIELPEQIGSPIPEGTWIDEDEVRIFENAPDDEGSIGILRDVLSRKLLPRSGFKYGTKWRLYELSVGEEHAPWLLQPEWLAPRDWAQACLSARLANGVHKTWLCGFNNEGSWCYIAIHRPPPEARWSGFRH